MPLVGIVKFSEKKRGRLVSLLAGVFSYLLVAVCLEKACLVVLFSYWNMYDQAYGSTPFYIAIHLITPGLFEECGRFFALGIMFAAFRERVAPAWFGVGYAYCEAAVIIGVGIATSTLSGYPLTFNELGLSLFERSFAIAAQMGLTLIVYESVVRRKRRLVLLAMALHCLMDAGALLYAKGLITSMIGAELYGFSWAIVIAAVCLLILRKERRAD